MVTDLENEEQLEEEETVTDTADEAEDTVDKEERSLTILKISI